MKSASLEPKIICSDGALAAELQKAGLEVGADAKIAWASNGSDARKYKGMGKLVLCPQVDLLSQGGAIAVIEEGGKPAIYLQKANLASSGVVLSDSIYKIAKIVP